MNRYSFFLICFFLFYPQIGLTFSDNELDALEDSGKKTFSKSPWRTELSLGLQRNIDLNTFHFAGYGTQQSLFATDEADSLLDISQIYYSIGLAVNYSFSEIANKLQYDFLKNVELFLTGSFATPFTGYNNRLEGYDTWQYIHYALGDLTFGFSTPIYRKESFLAYFSSSSLVPLSKFSNQAGLFSGVSGNLSSIYFLKKELKWSIAISTRHTLNYRHYTKTPVSRADGDVYKEFLNREAEGVLTQDVDGRRHSTPWSTRNSGSLIFKQSFYKVFPSIISVNFGYTFGVDTLKTRKHHFSWSLASSWKVKDRLYLNTSIRWIDLIYISNPEPEHKNIRKNIPVGWLDLRKYVFSVGGSYSF